MIRNMPYWHEIQRPRLSVVIPCYDEAGNIEPLLREIVAILRPLGHTFEIVVVDDASRDRTADLVAERLGEIEELRLVRHLANCGQSAALLSGFHATRGELVLTLDGDGQNDPASIPEMLAALGDADGVCGVRRVRHDSLQKRLASRIGNAVRRLVTRDATTDAGCNFRLLRREATLELPAFDGLHRWMGAILRYQGFRVVEREVQHRPRRSGRSKYGYVGRGVRGLFDCFAMLWLRRRCLPARRVATVHVAEPAR
jgi:dolichol-phosphate mannosyltransferase